MTPWEIFVFAFTTIYMLHRLVRNSLWDISKEQIRFREISERGPLQHWARQTIAPLIVGLLMVTVWNEIDLGWIWLAFGIFLVVIGVAPFVGLILSRITREPDFDWEPPLDSEIKIKVKKRKVFAIFFLLILGLWSYSWIEKVI